MKSDNDIIVELIRELTQEEMSYVTIYNPNPEFNTQGNDELVKYNNGKTTIYSHGRTLRECLESLKKDIAMENSIVNQSNLASLQSKIDKATKAGYRITFNNSVYPENQWTFSKKINGRICIRTGSTIDECISKLEEVIHSSKKPKGATS